MTPRNLLVELLEELAMPGPPMPDGRALFESLEPTACIKCGEPLDMEQLPCEAMVVSMGRWCTDCLRKDEE